MRFNNMTRDNDRKDDNTKYIMYAVLFAIISFFVLNIAFDIAVVVVKLAFNYWWAVLIGGLILLFLKKRGRKNDK